MKRKCAFLMFFFLLSLIVLIPRVSAESVYYNRYLHGTTWQQLNRQNVLRFYEVQPTSYDYSQTLSQIFGGGCKYAIRVYRIDRLGDLHEIAFNSPAYKAEVSRSPTGEGLQNGTWTPPITNFTRGDGLFIQVYMKTIGGAWTLVIGQNSGGNSFVSEGLGMTQLLNSTWTVQYYTKAWESGLPATGYYQMYWANATYKMAIFNMEFNDGCDGGYVGFVFLFFGLVVGLLIGALVGFGSKK